ncbi:BMC domain-containing protein [Lachnotalea glycerini]|uniref:BMC domain-containing protein n=1 Tax=Lachnotalea glycerini TaxID=1763509 RepID=A0A371JIQ5_9FIRM|nr:BMC domain-containing protein [Lachnotalea glycerini]RDY32623.1 BMC domain-containing protein [Lachnotalea glycerini]
MNEAVGLIEVFGCVAAFVAVDAACKAGNVRIEALDKNKPANADSLPVPLVMCVKMRGSISDVRAAMDAAEEAANSVTGVVSKHMIAAPDQNTEKMLNISAL